MPAPGGPEGNTKSSKDNRLWRNTIQRALAQGAGPEKLRRIAEKLIDMAADGDMAAIKELGDRIDGKPTAQVEVSGPDGDSIKTSLDVSGLPTEVLTAIMAAKDAAKSE